MNNITLPFKNNIDLSHLMIIYLSRGVTGEIIYVDSGYHIIGS